MGRAPFVLDMEESLKPDAPRIMPEILRLNKGAKEPNTLATRTTEIGDVERIRRSGQSNRVHDYESPQHSGGG